MTYIHRDPDDRPSDRELAQDHLEPATELEHAHGEGLICLACVWLKARREHLGLVPNNETDECERCAEQYVVNEGCTHGFGLCARCLHFCGMCRDDMADAESESLRDRLRDRWGR